MRGIHIFCLTLCISAAWSKSINDKIIGGQDAKQGQFPYQVSWFHKSWSDTKFFWPICSGSIFDDQTIITTGHCCERMGGIGWENSQIIAGDLDFTRPSEFEQVREIKDYLIHPDYQHNATSAKDDICLLLLDEPLEFNDNVQSIELDNHDPLDSTPCQVSGWGFQQVNDSSLTINTTILQWTEVVVKSDSFCHAIHEDLYDSSTMICTASPVSCIINESTLSLKYRSLIFREKMFVILTGVDHWYVMGN